MAKKPKTTTRSYTLGLLSTSEASDWQPLWNRLFQTHYAVCRGAREYGEFYLNLRGGLAASLAECADEQDAKRRRLLQRGARRMLALGWFSVESVRGTEHHPYRVRERVCAACNSLSKPSCERDHPDKVSELKPGQSPPPDLAQRLLRATLSTHKSVVEEAMLVEWTSDCVLALTAHIRPDAVIVNRAAAFVEWQKSVGDFSAEMPEQARRILFAMCGDSFALLTLPEEDAVTKDDEQADTDSSGADDTEGEDAGKAKREADDAEPSNASRGVFGDLFGGDAAEKVSRAAGKEEFAVNVRAMLMGLDAPPMRETIIAFRQQQGLPELDTSKSDKYPKEVSSSGAPTAVAKRYRKLLVGLNLWPKSDEENGQPRTQAVASFGKRVTVQDEQSRNAHINALDLIDACPEPTVSNDSGSNAAPTSARVFTPTWAPALAARVAAATNMPVNAKPLNEFKRLMFALAARRISQTQTWTKRNEAERHKAAVKEDAAKKKLEDLDRAGSARTWFSTYEERRGEDSQTSSDFRITRRMISECDAVFKAWQGTESADEREKKAASVQAKAEKFGDARLYADLSEDPAAVAIWQHEQGAEILKQWVKLRQAQFDQQRFKIPRFCHPDPFHHPTWCEFGGSSKPKVWYAWKPDSRPQSPEPGGDADGSRRLWMLLPDFAVRQAKAVPMRWRSKRLSQDLGGVRWHTQVPVPRADRLSLAAAKLPLLDANKEPIRYRPEHPFTKDAKGWNARLQLDRDTLERLERYWDDERCDWRDGGKALRNARWFVTFAPAFAASDGPGRSIHSKLGWKSSPHSGLNKKQKREGHAQLILSRLPGLRVLSVDLGHRYAAACAVWETLDSVAFDIRKIIADAKAKGWKVDGSADGLFVHIQEPTDKIVKNGRNKGKFVVETTIYRRVGEDFLRDPKTGKPTTTPHPAPWARLDRQFLIKLQGEEKPARAASSKPEHGINEVAIVVNVAGDLGVRFKDNENNFDATNNEDAMLRDLFSLQQKLRRTRDRGVDELMSLSMHIATLGLKRHGRMAKIAYALNPECPGIPQIGGGKDKESVEKRNEKYVDFLMKALTDWHALATDTDWDGSRARELWNTHIRPLPGGFEVGKPDKPDLTADGPTRQQKRKQDDEFRESRIKPISELLAKSNPSATRAMVAAWKALWEGADGLERMKDDFEHAIVRNAQGDVVGSRTTPKKGKENASGWHARLRLLTDWIMGRRLPGENSKLWSRNVGGLSLTRIATMRSLYQLHKAFAMRPTPESVQNAPKFGESNKGVAQGILDTMERMREQRVKQIASRIAASALGLGGHWKEVQRRDHAGKPLRGKDGRPRTKRVWVEEPSPKYRTCHAVVIENLRNYRPEETNARRENLALQKWAAAKVRKHLEEACQLHGLHLREVMPNYTSRQCSRTGLPGWRCEDIPVTEFVKPHASKPHRCVQRAVKNLAKGVKNNANWEQQLATAFKAADAKRLDPKMPGEAEDCLVVELYRRWDAGGRTWTDADGIKWTLREDRDQVQWQIIPGQSPRSGKKLDAPAAVRVLNKSGDLFVAAPLRNANHNSKSRIGTALQADLNAAANIGLRALLDPDFPGKWWYIPCIEDKVTGTATPRVDKTKGSVCFSPDPAKPEQFGSLVAAKALQDQNGKAGKRKRGSDAEGKETTNFWCDIGSQPLRNAEDNGLWFATPKYWGWVRRRTAAALWEHNGLRQQSAPGLAPDDGL